MHLSRRAGAELTAHARKPQAGEESDWWYLAGHNGGPPLNEEHTPEWGRGPIGNYFYWKAAHRAAWHGASRAIALFRMRRAERLGLTYDEYTLEILERGRHLQIEDVERIAEIKQARARKTK